MATKGEKLGSFASRFIDSVGDKSGSINMNVNGSVTPQEFKITAQEGEVLYINRMIVYKRDTGSFDSGGFGNGSELTNGVTIHCEDASGATSLDFTEQKPVKTNMDWAAYCYDVVHESFGSGDESLASRYTFERDGKDIKLKPGCSFIVTINDNLTGLNEFLIRVGMVSVPESYT